MTERDVRWPSFKKMMSHCTTEIFNCIKSQLGSREKCADSTFLPLNCCLSLWSDQVEKSGFCVGNLWKHFVPRMKTLMTPETRRSVLKRTYTLERRTPSLHLKLDRCSEREAWTYTEKRKGEAQRWWMRERERRAEREKKDQTLLPGDLWHLSSSPFSLQPANMLGETTRDSGKDRRRAFFKI